MKIALIHDYLNQWGGGERVLLALLRMFPDAPVYTLLYDEAKTQGVFKGSVRKTSFLDFPFVRRHHRFFIPLMPAAISSMNLKDEFDLIISDTAGFAKGIRSGKGTRHISYIHTPLRYAWETKDYFGHSRTARFFQRLFAPLFRYVRYFDYRAAQQPDLLLANSSFIADKVQRYYHRPALVVYPPVDLDTFYPEPIINYQLPVTNYFLALGRFLHYKRFDLIIDVFNELKLPLIIVGAGREEVALKKRATSSNIKFLPFQKNDADLRKLYNGARALVFPQVEDFGLVAAEAQACGTPVIGLNEGGTAEIVTDGVTGVLFDGQSVAGLRSALERFAGLHFDREVIAQTARRFSKENFEKVIRKAVEQLMS